MTAAGQPDGLAVLGMFIEIGSQHEEFDKVIQCLEKIPNKGDETPIEDQGVDCNNLLPTTHGFWTYPGSLTTPPLFESVTWIVFKEPIQVSEEQVSFCTFLFYKYRICNTLCTKNRTVVNFLFFIYFIDGCYAELEFRL